MGEEEEEGGSGRGLNGKLSLETVLEGVTRTIGKIGTGFALRVEERESEVHELEFGEGREGEREVVEMEVIVVVQDESSKFDLLSIILEMVESVELEETVKAMA